MAYADLKIITGIFLVQNKQILLLEKKIGDKLTRTIPFKTVYGLRHPSEHLKALVKDHFDVEIDEENFFKKILINKLDKEGKSSLGYFPSTIIRKGELKLNKELGIEQYDWFSYDDLPENITLDLRTIIEASAQDKKYLEIIESI